MVSDGSKNAAKEKRQQAANAEKMQKQKHIKQMQ